MDPELNTVSYAFDAAFQRMCEAKDDDALTAELSNVLHHLFRLRELCREKTDPEPERLLRGGFVDSRSARGQSGMLGT